MKTHPLASPALLHLAALALAGWAASGTPVWLVLAAGLVAAGGLLAPRGARFLRWAAVLLVAGVVAGFVADRHLDRISAEWPERAERWEAGIRERLSEALDELILAGEQAAGRLVQQVRAAGEDDMREMALGALPRNVDALALFGPGGELLAWQGRHQGPVPREVRLGLLPYIYAENALFGYLYVIRPLPEGLGTAVAASFLRADLPATLEDATADFVSRFRERTGARIQVARADRVEGESVWDFVWEGEALFSVTLVPLSEAEVRGRISRRWRLGLAALLLLAWGLVARGSREERGGAALAAGGLIVLIAALPVGGLLGSPRLFSPAEFLLPGPLDLTLGDLVALVVAAAFLLGFLTPRRPPTLHPLAAGGLALALALAFLWLVGRGASRDLLAGAEGLWIVVQAAAVVGATLFFAPLLLLGRKEDEERPSRAPARAWLAAALLASLALGVGSALWVRGTASFPIVTGLLWLLPLLGLTRAVTADPRWRAGAVRWLAAGTVATTLVLPWAWSARIDARKALAEERVDRLGVRPDPFLEFLLLRMGEEARVLGRTGRDPVEILYGAWTASELAREGVPLWLTWWSADEVPQEELRIGVPDPRPAVPSSLIREAVERDAVALRSFERPEAHYMVAAPVRPGAVVTGVVPPRRRLAPESPLGPLFSPARWEPDPLVLIPLHPEDDRQPVEGVRWLATRDGWQAEFYVHVPEEVYHAHYQLDLPGPLLLVARGSLLLLGNLVVLLGLWSAGRRLFVGPGGGLRKAGGWLGSFRGKVTLALFAFFLVPSIGFGTMAYRTLAVASVRAAESLAARAVEDASQWYFELDGSMELLATRVGSDLLLYEEGQLVEGSHRELVELGLYEGWLPADLHRDMARGEEIMRTASAQLGGWEYVVAYRSIPGGRVLAAPAPLQAGATAVRQREVADLLAASLLLGAGLSVLLSLLVGRALSRPIQTLMVASERVGAGNMGVHLPADRTDEFGAVFAAFNRMVDRLAHTRKALVRSSRRTRAIVEEVATGVIALDAEGRVQLANPRAEALLGAPLPPNRPLPRGASEDDPRQALARWLDDYMRDGLLEAGTELPFGPRRVRVRARRISRRGPSGGVVLALEDVTDELRTERILAWGEMAQQVAHEVKNPLTPIKLGVQHIRRAWRDRSADFERILDRNVEAILSEIERLSAIASSFSRYAAPTAAGEAPLERVEVPRVVSEVLDLYAAGDGAIEFGADLAAGLPPVRARPDELKEVLVNLLENARAAVPAGGHVTVEAEPVGGGVELRVRDDGSGIPEELIGRVFEPHFSTRSTGSGLGLAIVRRLVDSWEGWVEAESRVGEGTVVRVLLRPWREVEEA